MAFVGIGPGGVLRRLTVAAAIVALPPGLGDWAHGMPTAGPFSTVPVEQLNVPSSSMARDIRVEFLDGGEGAHAPLYLLTSMEAGDDFNGWDINTAAFDWYRARGYRSSCPSGGKSSFYSDWYGPATSNGGTYTYKWETFPTQELPAYLATNKNVPTTGNAVVGLSRWAAPPALILAAFHRRSSFTPGRSSGSSTCRGPVAGPGPHRHAVERRLRPHRHVGPVQRSRLGAQRSDDQCRSAGRQRHRPWIYCGNGAPTDPNLASPNAPIGLGSSRASPDRLEQGLRRRVRAAGGNNATFNFPGWHPQLGVLGPAAATDAAGHPADAWRHARCMITTTVRAVRVSAPCRSCSSAARR